MPNVYFWNARYKKGQGILIVGAKSKEDARTIIDAALSKDDTKGEIIAILDFVQIPHAVAQKRGILNVL